MMHIAYRAGVNVESIFDKAIDDIGTNSEVEYRILPSGFENDLRAYAGGKGAIAPSGITDLLKKRGILQALSALLHIANASGIDITKVYDTLQELWFPVAPGAGAGAASGSGDAGAGLTGGPGAGADSVS